MKIPGVVSGPFDALEGSLTSETAPVRGGERPVRWIELLGYRQTWGLILSKFLSDSA